MSRYLIQTGNGLLLIVVLIGIPEISSRRFGAYQISSISAWQQLTLWGLAGAATLNFLATFLLRKSKDRRACWFWTAVHGAVFTVEYLLFTGRIDFDWLENFLRRFAP